MKRTLIDEKNWAAFCEQFSTQHQGWLFSLAEMGSDDFAVDPENTGRHGRRMTTLMPFKSLTAQWEPNHHRTLAITADSDTGAVTTVVEDPIRIEFEETDEGGHRGLDVHTAGGHSVLLRFRAASQPEALDGLAESEQINEAGMPGHLPGGRDCVAAQTRLTDLSVSRHPLTCGFLAHYLQKTKRKEHKHGTRKELETGADERPREGPQASPLKQILEVRQT